jgi:hypothetical protein
MLMILCSLSLAQTQVPSVSATPEEGERKPSEMLISGVSPDFASLRDTINTFLLNMDNMFVPLLRRAGKLLMVAFALIYTSKSPERGYTTAAGKSGARRLGDLFRSAGHDSKRVRWGNDFFG